MSVPSVGSVALDLVAGNTGGFFKSVQSAGNTASKSLKSTFGGAFSAIGKMAAAAISAKAVTAFTKDCIEAASDLAEVQNVVDVTFKNNAETINGWAKLTQKAYGLSELAAKQYTGTMGAMLKSMKLSDESALDMSMNIAALAGDMASFYNLDTDTAFEKIRSGISGETEPLKQLGINLSVANLEAYRMSQGLTTAYNKMSQADQAVLRYNYLLSVTSDAQGDFARTSGGWANQTRILALNIESLKSSLGGLAIQALTPVIQKLNQIIEYAIAAANALTKLLGGTVKTSSAATGGMSGLSSSAIQASEDITDTQKTAQKAAKKIKASFADVDEIHVLGNKDDTSAADAAAAAGAGSQSLSPLSAYSEMDTSSSEKKLDNLLSKLKLFDKFDFKPLRTAFNNLKTSIEKFIDPVKKGLKWAYDNVLVPLAKWTIEKALPSLINYLAAGFDFLYEVLKALQPAGEWLWNNFLQPIASWTGGVIISVIDTLTSVLQNLAAILRGDTTIDEVVGKISGFDEAFQNTKDMLVSFYTDFLQPVYSSVKEKVQEIWNDHLKPLLDNIGGFARDAIQCALDVYNNGIVPVVNLIKEYVVPILTTIINGIVDVVKIAVGFLLDHFNNIITVLRGVLQFISGVFTGDWSKAWGGVKKIFSGVWNELALVIKTPINLILSCVETLVNCVIRGVNSISSALNKINITVPDWVPVYGGRKFGFNLKQINQVTLPRLKDGGYLPADNPRLAIVGDNKREGEIVSPESKIREQVELALSRAGGVINDIQQLFSIIKQAIKEALTESSFGGDWHITVVDDSGNVRAEEIISAVERKNRRDGRTVIRIGG